jgi:hypothetical protein
MKELNLPKEVAEECWLLEGIYYLGLGYIPYYFEYCDELLLTTDYRRQAWFHDGDDILDEINENISNFMDYKFDMPDPVIAMSNDAPRMRKYRDVKLEHVDNIDKDSFDKETSELLSKINFENEESEKYYKDAREEEKRLTEELKLLCTEYDNKINLSTEDKNYELYLLLKSGKIRISGQPFYATQEHSQLYPLGDYALDKDGYKYYDVMLNHYGREKIDSQNISFNEIKWENSALFTKDGRFYINILISFKDLYEEKPQQLEYEIKAKLLGDRIIYNEKTYQEIGKNSTRGRKSLEWDLFYTELFRYIFEDCKGELPNKQYLLIDYMQKWCKQNLKAGSYGAIQERIKKIYDSLKSQKIEK